MSIVLALVCVLGILIVLFFIGMIFYLRLGIFKTLYHDLLEWHEPAADAAQWSDGCSQHSTCKYCGKDIMMDSQGNWF